VDNISDRAFDEIIAADIRDVLSHRLRSLHSECVRLALASCCYAVATVLWVVARASKHIQISA